MMNKKKSKCLFCEIYKQQKSLIIYKNKNIFVINDIYPQAPLHMLFIPKIHIQSINEINESNMYIINDIFLFIKLIMKKNNITDYRIINNNGVQSGQSINHIHFHVLANRKFYWPPG